VAGNGLKGASYSVGGRSYYYAETTGDGWAIGEVPPELEGTAAQVIPITGEQYRPGSASLGLPSLPLPAAAVAVAAVALRRATRKP
jgi:hypothetical protein